ncbi:hypothetical protein IAR55_000408 [Kwoniella newhampshirensis]|uniref:Chromo domain-containing protein n=1 Tax=Kwoniella newhampshirensis TaxID=1651941 RepID=A0AAW0Z6N0_9TREE
MSGIPPPPSLTYQTTPRTEPPSPLLVTPSPPRRRLQSSLFHPEEPNIKGRSKRPRLEQASYSDSTAPELPLDYKEAKSILTTLEHMADLLQKNEQDLQRHQERYIALVQGVEKRLMIVEERLAEITTVKEETVIELERKMSSVIDQWSEDILAEIKLAKTKAVQSEPLTLARSSSPEGGFTTSTALTEYFTPFPTATELDPSPQDLLDMLDSLGTVPDALTTIDPAQLPVPSAVQSLVGMGQIPITSVVDAAIEAERARLGGVPVLQEGESTIQFTMRKRLHRVGQELGMPLVDLSDFLSDTDAKSYLSSGVDSLPESEPLPRRVRPPAQTPSNTQLARSRSGTWNPFPHPYMRQGSVLPQQSLQGETGPAETGQTDNQFVRGASLIRDSLLAPGEGDDSTRGAKWPKYGINTVKGRMQEIVCDICGGRVHWACAGLPDGASMWNEAWSCPECIAIQREYAEAGSRAPSIPRAQQERCLRNSCIYRSMERIVRKPKDDDEFYLERIIGRKAVGRQANGKRTFKYLVKWWDWQSYDSTWEPAKNIPDLKRNDDIFLHAAREADINVNYRVALLPEAQMWFTDTGEYKKDLLRMLGVDGRAWWDDK